ncbi:MAG: LPP20 family lipoprotein [Candidatus Cloacimonetes bacterium]|nr:LPP20 family lipoprotein [Candidatus Cloacimonadota bacterium]MCF7813207.1 LPP20 family lipoprotein [Candidatus Cloacimonadota bacterium]MCF7867406.1 LPP20 family lipoprotein [Candidatus Cloacimonadota bacterium]MCF7882962.1 LPP20 family lipoprotein [Candidatus Cloacimonadota bacterium]
MKNSLIFLVLALISNLVAQEPEWVNAFIAGRAIENAQEYYFGIGIGNSFKESDDDARCEFAKNVEIKIAESILNKRTEINSQASEEFSMTSEITTDMILRGVFITERYYDENEDEYFSLICIVKEDFFDLIQNEIELEKQRKAEILAQTQEMNQLDEQLKSEELKKDQTELDYKKKKLQLKKEKEDIEYGIYEDFLCMQPPRRIISIETACISKKLFSTDFKLRIAPYKADKIDFSLRLGIAEFIVRNYWQNEEFNTYNSSIRLQLLPHAGRIVRYSISAGMESEDIPNEIGNKNFKEMNFSPRITGTICLPMYYSFVSCFVSNSEAVIAEQLYFPWDVFGEMLSFTAELKYVWNEDSRNKFGDEFLFQPGIHFQPTKTLGATFSYEENQKFIFTFEWSI